MPTIDSKTGKIRKKYTIDELKEAAALMRGYNIVALNAAGSGHSGGTLSIMDITAALYLDIMDHDPDDASWDGRDRVIWSAGHKAPSLYIGLGISGYFNIEEVVTLRKLYSPFQGHPHWLKLPGIEASTGSLGQGLSIAVGMALAAKLDNKKHKIYSINGDGEQQEGQIWEAVMEAAHFKLDNLITIIDKNRLQIDGWVKDVMEIEPIAEKYRAFNWNVIEIDGHDMEEIVQAFNTAKEYEGKPTAIIANTIKGKGVDFMENVAGWHGKSPNKEQMESALEQIGVRDKLDVEKLLKIAEDYQKEVEVKLEAKMPKFKKNYFWNEEDRMKADMDPTRKGFGRCLSVYGDDERVVCIGQDISGSITISQFYEDHPQRKSRFLSLGIAEQSGTAAAAGLAREGKLPVIGTYGTFASARNLDQLRTTVCYGNFNVFVVGAHGGVSVGPDGATHQALEELFQMCGLPNMAVAVPCDSIETKKISEYLLFKHDGPKYVRFAREATPIVTTEETPMVFGKANVIRYKGKPKEKFIDAFETVLASEYKSRNEPISLIACGPSVPEAMRAAYILKEDYGLESRIVNIHTVKPIDREAIIRAGLETNIIITAEEHQVGGIGNQVSAVLTTAKELFEKPRDMGMVGVKDRFGESGFPWELVKEFEVSGEHIAQLAKELYDYRKKKDARRLHF